MTLTIPNLLLVMAGGILGGLSRYQLGQIIASRHRGIFPLATFVINVSGAFALGFLSSLTLPSALILLFGQGFLGSFTTFSTLMYEELNLILEGEFRSGLYYLGGTIGCGILGYICGASVF